ncbi:MAG: Plug and carboxypeptidase regulatory-like domain-containing protein [Acidobacteriota bacterium]|nr:Plug and carboxypeptidase regulatory-like domain-containing protein [Acidobacteriota bacterium]
MFRTTMKLFMSLLLVQAVASAQLSTTTQVKGTVIDESGAVVPGAKVTVVNDATRFTTATESNADGSFVLSGLPPGTYSVTVVKDGFQTFKTSDLVLHPATVATLNASLRLGSVGSEVSVVASTSEVQTTTSELSNLVSDAQIGTLPLNGRNFQALAALMPGVVNQSAGSAIGTGGYTTSNVMSINGLSTNTTFYALDGIWNENTGNMNQLSVTPNPDTLEEVRVLQNNYSPKYSLLGASVVLLQTKSGTASFHGSIFEYFRNDDLNARNFFSPTVPTLKQNIFGYTFGGPVLVPFYHGDKKTFFFISEQWVNAHTGSVVRGLTPTADQRNGLFSTAIKDPVTGQNFTKNAAGLFQIPADRLNPNSLAFINALYPLPNNPAGGTLNYINLTPALLTQRDDQFKVDHNFSERFRLTAEYFAEHQNALASGVPDSGSPFPTNRRKDVTLDQLAQIQFTAVISPAMVNSASIAMNRYTVDHPVEGLLYVDQIPGYKATLPFNGALSNRIPLVTLSQGWSPQGIPANLPRNAGDLDDTLSDDWSWLKGKHFISAGANLVFNTKRQIPSTASNGQWTFTGTFTGNAMADFLLGNAATFTQISTTVRPYIHATQFSPYIEDRIQLTRRLTITLGTRISFMPLPHPQTGFEAIFDPSKYDRSKAPIVNANGTLTLTPNYDPGNGLVINGINGVPNNWSTAHQWYWAPSAGFAWNIFGDGSASLRGGYGVNYTRIFTGQDCSYNCAVNPPIIQSVNLVNPTFPSPGGSGTARLSAPTIANADLNIQATQVQSYSLSLERQIRSSWIVSVAGAGTLGRHLPASWNYNQPLPNGQTNFNPIINSGSVFQYIYGPYYGYGPINTLSSVVNSNWTALELSARHPMGANLFLQLAYTWAHGLSNSSTINTYNARQYYGSTSLNVPQVFTASAIYSIPWLKHASGWKRLTIAGWQLSDVTTVRAGYSLSPGLSIPQQGLGARPDLTGDSLTGTKTVAQWFNTAAFKAPLPGYFGNAGTGIIRGPGLINFDMTLYKDFSITEKQKVQFRAEVFNVFNHTNFTTVSTTFGSASFGQVTAAADPRIMELVLRYQF